MDATGFDPTRFQPRDRPRPIAVAAVPGTPYGLVVVEVPATVSGLAVASLVAGLGSILTALVVAGLGAVGAQDGWGPQVAGAFATLAVFVGLGGLGLGLVALGRIRRAVSGPVRFTGRGLALAGTVCGPVGIGFAVLAMLLGLGLAT